MKISVDVSYYPFSDDAINKVEQFLNSLQKYSNLNFKINFMSTQITGEFDDVFNFLKNEIYSSFENYKSFFVIKITNAYENPEEELRKY